MEANVENIIVKVNEHSLASEMGIQVGDKLIAINGQKLVDIIEYMFLTSDEYLEVEIEKKDGTLEIYEVEKDFDEELGIEFKNPIIDQARSCHNKCIFCFIDQLPPNMRKTLYFKDDDSRLSFLQGNFITLTNMTQEDFDKIVRYRISPVNISIHTTNGCLRAKMLHNKKAAYIHEKLQKLSDAGIKMNGQIVLCKGINDGKELDRTIEDLSKLYPQVQSVAIVPVGITKFRDGLYPLEIFDKESSYTLIKQIKDWQNLLLEKIGSRFIYLSDEFYVMAQREIPVYEEYEQFLQVENGVGLMAKFKNNIETTLKDVKEHTMCEKVVSIATGKSAEKFIRKMCKIIENRFKGLKIHIYGITNEYFGSDITVAGLITGTDLIKQLKGKELGERLILPESMFKMDEPIFLDDYTQEDIENALNIEITVSKVEGEDFIQKIIKG